MRPDRSAPRRVKPSRARWSRIFGLVTALKLRIEPCHTFLLVVCLVAGLLPILKAQTKPPPLSQKPPLWSIKSKQVAYSLPTYGHAHRMIGRHRVKIQFLDDQRLALAWQTSDESGEKPIGPAMDVPSHLRLAGRTPRVVLFLDRRESCVHCSDEGLRVYVLPSAV